MKIDLGCGKNKLEGYVGLDATQHGGVDIIWDLNKYPYPVEEGSVDELNAAHIIEHLDDSIAALKECSRMLKDGGRAHIRVPHFSSRAAWNNPEHRRAFAMGWFHELTTGEHSKEKLPFNVSSIKFHYSCGGYQPGKPWQRILDYLANNIHQRWFERVCIFWFGGYEEMEVELERLPRKKT